MTTGRTFRCRHEKITTFVLTKWLYWTTALSVLFFLIKYAPTPTA